jgi:NADPH-dependent 2,4-dienoyl-CoA reductase/sulfur reductase-like enzyme
LIYQFLSPYTNKRTDKYGGSVLNRVRFAVECIERTKARCGRDFPIIFRMNGEDYYVSGGITLEESWIHAHFLEKAGVDCFDVSGGNSEFPVMVWQPNCWPRSCFLHLADAIKRVVHVPVITVGRIGDPRLAETILQEGKADLVAMGRALIADPELPNKARDGKFDDIRWCIRCNECGGSMWGSEDGGACSVNACFGHESESKYEIKPAKTPKNVIVIGGGPAGMEAARVAASRGHKVSLYEQSDVLGGQLLIACLPPHKEEIRKLVEYLTGQIKKLKVDVHLGKKITAGAVSKLKPDAVIVAVGGTPIIPDIPGIEQSNVLMAKDVLNGQKETGNSVIIIGGGRVGCELGEFLAAQGKQVTIVEMLDQLAAGMNPTARGDLLNSVNNLGVKAEVKAKVEKITPRGILANIGGKQVQLDADNVVISVGYMANTELAEELKKNSFQVYNIGDSENPRRILEASRSGYLAGLSV